MMHLSAKSINAKKLLWAIVIQWTIVTALSMHPHPGRFARRQGGPNPKLHPPGAFNQQIKQGPYSSWPIYGPRYQQQYNPSIITNSGRPIVPAPSPPPASIAPPPPPQPQPQQKHDFLNIPSDQGADSDLLFPPVENIPLVFSSGQIVQPSPQPRPPPPSPTFAQSPLPSFSSSSFQPIFQQHQPMQAPSYNSFSYLPQSHGHISLWNPSHAQHRPTEPLYFPYQNALIPAGSYGIRPPHQIPPSHVHIVGHSPPSIQQLHLAGSHHMVKLVPPVGSNPPPFPVGQFPLSPIIAENFQSPQNNFQSNAVPSQMSHSNPLGISSYLDNPSWHPSVGFSVTPGGGQIGAPSTRIEPAPVTPMSLFVPDGDGQIKGTSQYIPVLLTSDGNFDNGLQLLPSSTLGDDINKNPSANRSFAQHDSFITGSDNVAVFLSAGGAQVKPPTGGAFSFSGTSTVAPPIKSPPTRPSLSSILLNLSHPVPIDSTLSTGSQPQSSPTVSTASDDIQGITTAVTKRPRTKKRKQSTKRPLFSSAADPAEEFGVPADAAGGAGAEEAAEGSFVEVLSQLLEEVAGIIEDFPASSELPGLDPAGSASNAADSLGSSSLSNAGSALGNVAGGGATPDIGGAASGLGAAAGDIGGAAGDIGGTAPGLGGAAPDIGGGIGGLEGASAGGAMSGFDSGALGSAGPGVGGEAAGPGGAADSVGMGSDSHSVVRAPSTLDKSQESDSPSDPAENIGAVPQFILLPPVNPQITQNFGQIPQSASDVMRDVFNRAIHSNALEMPTGNGIHAGPATIDPNPNQAVVASPQFDKDASKDQLQEQSPILEPPAQASEFQEQHTFQNQQPDEENRLPSGKSIANALLPEQQFTDPTNDVPNNNQASPPLTAVDIKNVGQSGSQPIFVTFNSTVPFSSNETDTRIDSDQSYDHRYLSAIKPNVSMDIESNGEISYDSTINPLANDEHSGNINQDFVVGSSMIVAPSSESMTQLHPNQPEVAMRHLEVNYTIPISPLYKALESDGNFTEVDNVRQIQEPVLPQNDSSPETSTIRDYHTKAQLASTSWSNIQLDENTTIEPLQSPPTSIGYSDIESNSATAADVTPDIREEVQTNISIDLTKTNKTGESHAALNWIPTLPSIGRS